MSDGGRGQKFSNSFSENYGFFAQQHCLSFHLFWSCLAGHVTGKDRLTAWLCTLKHRSVWWAKHTHRQTARQQIHSESSPSSSSPQLMSQFDVCWPADWLLNRGTSSESRFAYEFVHSLIVEQNLLLLPRFAFSFTFIPATAISSHYLEGPPPPTLKSNQQLPVRSF